MYELVTDGRLIFSGANPAAGEILGIDHDRLVGKTIEEAFPAPANSEMPGRYRDTALTGQAWGDDEVTYEDGTVKGFFEVDAFQTSPRRMVAAFTDITQSKRTEQEKERMQSRLLEGQKLEAVGTLAGGIAHDFNNLLSYLHGYCDLAMLKVEEDSAIYRDLAQILDAAARARDLTSHLLLFSRKQPMEVSVVDLNEVLRSMLDMLTRLIGENICVRASFDHSIWAIRGDRSKIEQVIVNLVVNARDAMPGGRQIAITTENVTLDGSQCVLIPEANPGKYVCLSVSDEGTGMDDLTLQRVFEPFFTTKEAGRGTGLGLSVVHGIIRQHGGWTNVYSEPGKGSTFKVFFSAMTAQSGDRNVSRQSLQRCRSQGERVLVVEDEDPVRELVVRILTENGYDVLEAAGSAEALRVFGREEGRSIW